MTLDVTPPESFREQRRRLLTASPVLRGLDYVTSRRLADRQWRLRLRFVPAPAGGRAVPGLAPGKIILWASPGRPLDGVRIETIELREELAEADLVLGVPDAVRAGELAADPRIYTLELVDLEDVDRFFARAPFSFSRELVSRQLAPPATPLLEAPETPEIDYLAKDYQSFRALMLDRMAFLLPEWQERNPSDLGVAIIEALAYAGDYLSYYQDAVATEAYLRTARRRISIRRFGRLMDYHLGEGCNSRVWVQLQMSPPEAGSEPGNATVEVPRGTQLLTGTGELVPAVLTYGSWQYEQALAAGFEVFETTASVRLHPRQHRMSIYAWGTPDYVLPQGATWAALAGHDLGLAAGDLVAFEQVRSPTSGRRRDADARFRHVVRLAVNPSSSRDPANPSADGRGPPLTEIRWFAADALPFSLPVSAPIGGREVEDLAVARGNLVLADQGRTVVEELPEVTDPATYRPTLAERNLIFRRVVDPDRLRRLPARTDLDQSPAGALPAVTLVAIDETCLRTADELPRKPGETWLPETDLLASDGFARSFVVEIDDERRARLRFGDGRYGRAPESGSAFQAYYRVGGGTAGNVGHDAIAHVVTGDQRLAGVRNPLAAASGQRWESLEHARLEIPDAYHRQRRCVTAADFVAAAEREPEVRRAVADLRWTGSWTTAFLYLQRRGGRPVDGDFRARIHRALVPSLVAGYDLAVLPPAWAALVIALKITIGSTYEPEVVENQLLDAFSDQRLAGGETGFFYPDNFTFAQPVYLSDLIARAGEVSGVVEVVAKTFRRDDEAGRAALQRGYVAIADHEIARVSNRPQAPQLGTIDFIVEAGR